MSPNINWYKQARLGGKQKNYSHRLIVERSLGRKLANNEHVHHIDGNKHNNQISNLIVLTNKFHLQYHAYKIGLGKDRIGNEPSNKTDILMRQTIKKLRMHGVLLREIQRITGLSWPTVQKYAKEQSNG